MPSVPEGAGEREHLLAKESARSAHGLFENGNEAALILRPILNAMDDDFSAWLAQPTEVAAPTSASETIKDADLNWATWSEAIKADAREAFKIWYHEPLTDLQNAQLVALIQEWNGQNEEAQFQTLHELEDQRLLVTLVTCWLPAMIGKTDSVDPFFKALTGTVESEKILRRLSKKDNAESLGTTWADFSQMAHEAKLDAARLLHYQLLQSFKYVDRILRYARCKQYDMIIDLLDDLYQTEDYMHDESFPHHLEIAPCDPEYVVPDLLNNESLLAEMQMIGHILTLCEKHAATGKVDALALDDEMKLLFVMYSQTKKRGSTPNDETLSHLIIAHYLATQIKKMVNELAHWNQLMEAKDLSAWPSNVSGILYNLTVLIVTRSWYQLQKETRAFTGVANDHLMQWLGSAIKADLELIVPANTTILHQGSIWREIKDAYGWPYKEPAPVTQHDGQGNGVTRL